MKIAMVLRQLQKKNGAARGVLQRAELLSRMRHEVHVFGERLFPKNIEALGAHAHRVPTKVFSGGWGRWLFQKLTEKQIAHGHFDLTIAHGDLMTQDVLFLHNCVHLMHELVHGKPLPTDHVVGQRHAQLLKNGQYKLLIANSALMKNDIVRRFGIPPDKIAINFPGYDPREFPACATPPRQIRQELGLPDLRFAIGLITSGEARKRGVDTLIKSYLALPEKLRSETLLLILGKNMNQDFGHMVPNTDAARIKFLEPQKNVNAYYAALDLFILPARLEEFGRSALEAATTGRAALISQQVGALEVMTDLHKKWSFPPEDVPLLTQNILALLQSPEALNQLAQAGLRLRDTTTEEVRLQELIKLLQTRQLIPT